MEKRKTYGPKSSSGGEGDPVPDTLYKDAAVLGYRSSDLQHSRRGSTRPELTWIQGESDDKS